MGRIKEWRMGIAEEIARLVAIKYKNAKCIEDVHIELSRDISNFVVATCLVNFYVKYSAITRHLTKLALHRGE